MPYCDDCDHYWTPTSLRDDGSCPSCGTAVEPQVSEDAVTELDDELGDDKVPWHFKVMVVALIVYLGWRFFELGAGLFG